MTDNAGSSTKHNT